MREAVRKPLFQGHLVGSLLPIPEVEGKEGSRYPRHRWTFSFSVMCYFQIRRRTLLTGYFKAQERKKQDCNALRPRTLFSALSAYSAKRNSKTATWAIGSANPLGFSPALLRGGAGLRTDRSTSQPHIHPVYIYSRCKYREATSADRRTRLSSNSSSNLD